ncbi:MAG TPA: sulfotransferase [Saprospiraceae bacterium]|nr:sulfotransferase [Saprospiraceae bacterium]HMQ83739.1 sulfotransferase [Saprospiraceae bacterium]
MSKPIYEQIIYIFGHSRGGTSLIGDILSRREDANYLFEPFASQAHEYTGFDTQTLFNNGRFLRLNKKGERTVENISPFFEFSTDLDPTTAQYIDIPKAHIKRLIQIKGFSPKKYLFLKQPRVENIHWVAQSLKPDAFIFINRHPYGIISSYIKGNHFAWLETELPAVKRLLELKYPELRPALEQANTQPRQELVLTLLRNQIANDFIQKNDSITSLDYDELCNSPFQSLQALEKIGLDLDEGMKRYVSKLMKSQKTFQENAWDTTQNLAHKSMAWQRELPLPVWKDLNRFCEEMALSHLMPAQQIPAIPAGFKHQPQKSFHNKSIPWRIKRAARMLLTGK